ncbi:Facilitated trehalose transporter Tret1-2-like protein [Frankliniella fusca]|uniref:Facilitated trehalose transporter Tret1-2-like protein n=1 Tax=Frankliniella fusca TaxID=407009 RepID=A0AAE1H0M1_9NEOP|nr:Facilitated trehalose transporter Tret1-2-like protein [Frankliniella fusca]
MMRNRILSRRFNRHQEKNKEEEEEEERMSCEERFGMGRTWSGEKEVFLNIRNGPPSSIKGSANGSPMSDTSARRPSSASSAKLPEVLACCSALSFHFALGLVLAFSAVLLPQLEDPNSDLKISKEEASLVASVVALSVPLGSLMTAPVMEALGRVRTVQLATAPYLLGCALIALANGFPMLVAGRFLTGVAAGTFGANPAIVYTTEVARPELRGSLISIGPFMVSLGTFVTYIVGAYLHWRTLAWAYAAAPILTVLLMLLWTPESPLWLASKGRQDRALRSVRFLARRDPDKLARAEADVAALVRGAEERRAAQRRGVAAFLATLFTRRSGLRPLLVITVLFAMQQFSGIYVTLFFAVSFFKDVRSPLNPNTASMLVGAIRVVCSIQATFMMRRFGRRPLLMVSAGCCALSMAVSGYFARMITATPDDGGAQMVTVNGSSAVAGLSGDEAAASLAPWVYWVPVIAILVYVYGGMLGLLTIPWTMTAELFAPRVRSLGQGVSVALANIFMFAAVQSYKDLATLLGGEWAVHWFYASVSLSGVVFTYLFVPETHRRTLAEIEEYFDTSLLYPAYQRRRRQQRDGLVVNRADAEVSADANGTKGALLSQ